MSCGGSKNSEEREVVKIDLERNEKGAVDVRGSSRGGSARDVTRYVASRFFHNQLVHVTFVT